MHRRLLAQAAIALSLAAPAPARAQAAPDAVVLQLLRDKGLLSEAEYAQALGRLAAARPPIDPPQIRSRWDAELYGFVQLDTLYDTTQSFGDQAANAAIARPDSYAGEHGRLTFSVRHSRLGLRVRAPAFHRIVASAQVEMDFMGALPPTASEAAVFTSPVLRMRHLLVRIETPYFDVLVGQTWQLFGWQPLFQPSTVEIQGLPGQVFGRSPQIRLSRLFHGGSLDLEVAAAVVRPAQRDSYTPDGQAGVRLALPGWTGAHANGATGAGLQPLGLGVSGLVRRLAVPELSATPRTDVSVTGYGVSVDAFVPLLRATAGKRGHALNLLAAYAAGAGTSDMYSGLTGGVASPQLPPSGLTPAPVYTPDVDPGLVSFDAQGRLGAVRWASFFLGAEYHLPPAGRLWLSAYYSQLNSDNAHRYGAPSRVFTQSRWADANLFFDATPALRLGLEYAWFNQGYADGVEAQSHRVHLGVFYLF